MKARNLKRFLINFGITLVFGAVYFYLKLPAINLHDPNFYTFFFLLALVYFVLCLASFGLLRAADRSEFFAGVKKNCLIPALLCAALALVLVIGTVIGLPIFRARSYASLLTITDGDFAAEVDEISFGQIPMLDEDSAKRLGDRQMGELAEYVSQFEVADDYTQINYHGRPVRVTPLVYGDLIKWFTNRSEGLPAYLVIDMVTQAVDVVRLDEGMKYTTAEHFSRNLYRHLRFNYPTMMFDDATFEIDEDGTPYWVCPRIVKRIGLFGGTDVQGAVLVNAVTGESEYYDEVPTWVDRVYIADLIMQQYDYHGSYSNGFLNSIFGQKDVTVTTDGYNYIVIDDDVYMYTGITSVMSDQSNIGFMLSNQRTKQTRFYSVAGATESSAEASAESLVQQMRYRATFPLLLNISGQPTYFMALKGDDGLVKMYAMVNVEQYNIVASGASVAECERSYVQLLSADGLSNGGSGSASEISGTVEELRTAVIEGNTHVFIRLEGDDFFYVISVADSRTAAVVAVGDEVVLDAAEPDGSFANAYDVRITG